MAKVQFYSPDRRLTDKTDCLTPLRACACGVIIGGRPIAVKSMIKVAHGVRALLSTCTSSYSLFLSPDHFSLGTSRFSASLAHTL